MTAREKTHCRVYVNASELLMAKDWVGLANLFSSTPPVTALDFQARALLAVHQHGGRPNWKEVLVDFEQACTLAPRSPMLRVNFAQALLDSGHHEEAKKQALLACELDPASRPPLEKLGLACVAVRDFSGGLQAFDRAAAVPGPALAPALAKLHALLRTRWWEPQGAGSVMLRAPHAEDADFLARSFADREFMRQFHRLQASGQDAVAAFIRTAALLPLQTRRIDWIVTDVREQRIGIAGLVDIDWGNGRGEYLVGFPGPCPRAAALQASAAAIRFAFERLVLEKLVSFVYADNPAAQSNTLHLGFREEGLLRSHIASEGRRIDLFANGMLRSEFESSPLFARLRLRWHSTSRSRS
jgi:RimJ/RimL family protein N-acetyltransferase